MKFYILNSLNPHGAKSDFVPVDGSALGQAERCPVCERFLSMIPLVPPIVVELEFWGGAYGDVVFGPADEILVSDVFWEEFRTRSLTGLGKVGSVHVAEVKKHKKIVESVPEYVCVRINRTKTRVDVKASRAGMGDDEFCWCCGLGPTIKRLERIVVAEDTWGGESIFEAQNLPGVRLVSEPFRQFCLDHGFQSLEFVPSESYGFDNYPWEHD